MILITGASGLLGASLVTRVHDLGNEVAGLYHQHPLQIPGVRTCRADLRDRRLISDLVTDLRPRTIIHCAAVTNVDWCEDHPLETERVNVEAAACLAEVAWVLKARFVYISTDSVFDGMRGNYTETDEPAPLNLYAKSKLRGEQEVLRRHPSALVVRVNIYGWNAQEKRSLAEWILGLLTAGKQVPGFTDVYFTPMLVNDLAEVLLAMLDEGMSGLYHVVGSERISKYEFARCVARTFGFDPRQVIPAALGEARLRAPRPLDTSLSTEKIAVALGRSMPDVGSGLRRFRGLQESGCAQQLKSYLAGVLE